MLNITVWWCIAQVLLCEYQFLFQGWRIYFGENDMLILIFLRIDGYEGVFDCAREAHEKIKNYSV